jgi:hypothetical protein
MKDAKHIFVLLSTLDFVVDQKKNNQLDNMSTNCSLTDYV